MATPKHQLRLRVVPGRFAVCRLPVAAEVPLWADGGAFVSITRARQELSIVCDEMRVPGGTLCERGFAALGVEGTLAPDLVGVMVSIATPLADAGIPILAIGTYDTDYVLVRESDLMSAVTALRGAGHDVSTD
jgi:uncharacterized protein